jgi:hypothetical protein
MSDMTAIRGAGDVVASLHDLACAGPSDCSCTPTYLVRETPTDRTDVRYNEQDGVASNVPANMRAARLGATPLGRAARHSGVDE